ncbi:MAG: hypothetical protein V1777_04060 [Candidatus Micrarchaeota archaeon]
MKAKTFDVQNREFQFYRFAGDLDVLERLRYFQAQLNTLLSRIDRLIELFSSGQGVGSKEGTDLLALLEKQNLIIAERLNFSTAIVRETAITMQAARKNIMDVETKKRISSIAEKIKVLEQEVGIERVNDRAVMLNLIEHIQSIRRRLLVQEQIIEQAFGFSIDRRIEAIKQEIDVRFGKETGSK